MKQLFPSYIISIKHWPMKKDPNANEMIMYGDPHSSVRGYGWDGDCTQAGGLAGQPAGMCSVTMYLCEIPCIDELSG